MTKLEEIMLAALGGAESAGEYHYDDAVIRAAVLAALKAMREPSEWQMQAAMNTGQAPLCDGEIRNLWEVMIDHLLSESPG